MLAKTPMGHISTLSKALKVVTEDGEDRLIRAMSCAEFGYYDLPDDAMDNTNFTGAIDAIDNYLIANNIVSINDCGDPLGRVADWEDNADRAQIISVLRGTIAAEEAKVSIS